MSIDDNFMNRKILHMFAKFKYFTHYPNSTSTQWKAFITVYQKELSIKQKTTIANVLQRWIYKWKNASKMLKFIVFLQSRCNFYEHCVQSGNKVLFDMLLAKLSLCKECIFEYNYVSTCIASTQNSKNNMRIAKDSFDIIK